ncbi:hypothetical protein COOONC_21135 [Cooperia oncophora]
MRVADFTLVDGELMLYKQDGTQVFVVPQNARHEIFREAHAGPFGAHFSAQKLLHILSKLFWSNMAQDINKWTRRKLQGKVPTFILHGRDPKVPNRPYYSVLDSRDDYKTELLQGVAKDHERVKEHNDRVR